MLPESIRTWCQTVTRMRSKAGAKQDCGGLTLPAVRVLLFCQGTTAAPANATSRVMYTLGGERKDGASVEEEREQRGTN